MKLKNLKFILIALIVLSLFPSSIKAEEPVGKFLGASISCTKNNKVSFKINNLFSDKIKETNVNIDFVKIKFERTKLWSIDPKRWVELSFSVPIDGTPNQTYEFDSKEPLSLKIIGHGPNIDPITLEDTTTYTPECKTAAQSPATPKQDQPGIECDPKGDIDPDTWHSDGLFCDKVKKGEIAEQWSCGRTIKYANSKADSACNEKSHSSNPIQNFDNLPYSSTIDTLCETTSDPTGCRNNSQKCLDTVKDISKLSYKDADQAIDNFLKCFDNTKGTVARNIKEYLGNKQYGAWVGSYCAASWKAHHPDTELDNTNGVRCENAVRSIQFKGVKGCQNLPASSAADGSLESCIRTAADSVFKPQPARSRTVVPLQPAAQQTVVTPAITTPAIQKNNRRQEILDNWCAAYLGANTDKANLCVSEAGTKCADPNLTNEPAFTKCVKDKGAEMQKGTTPAQGAAAPSSQRQPASPQKPGKQQAAADDTKDIEIIPTVDGYQQVAEGTYPANTSEVIIGAKAFKAGDKNQNCLLLNLDLTLIKTADEKGSLLPPAPAARIKTLIDKEGKNAGKEVNPQTAQNCHPYIAKLVGPGKYRFFAKSNDKTSKDIAFSVGGLAPKSADIKAFTCVTLAQASGNSISATANPDSKLDPKESYLGYDRAAWYIKKGVSKDSDLVYDPNNKDQNKKGDNCQFEGKGEGCQNAKGNDPTTFDNLEENQEYTVSAVAYPSKGNKEAVACAPTKPIKTAAKQGSQVLAVTSEDLSAAAVVLGINISSDELSNVMIRSIGYDGQPVNTLYEGQIAGDQVINVKVLQLIKVNKVETIVTPVTESGEKLDSKTYTTNLPDLTNITVNLAKVQSVQLSQNPQDSSFTKDALKHIPITIMAVTNLPVENPVFINTANNERFIIEAQDISNNCSADNEEKCVYQINLGGELVKEDNYSIKFAQGDDIFETDPLSFTISSGESGGIEPAEIIDQGGKVITRVVLSKDDGTFEQVVYTLDQGTNQGYFADAEFDLTEGVNGLKYTIDYADGTQKEIIFVVERTAETEPVVPAPIPAEPDLTPSADLGNTTSSDTIQTGEYCSSAGDYDRVCAGDDGTYKFRQCQENNIWSDWLGSETNPDQSCRTE